MTLVSGKRTRSTNESPHYTILPFPNFVLDGSIGNADLEFEYRRDPDLYQIEEIIIQGVKTEETELQTAQGKFEILGNQICSFVGGDCEMVKGMLEIWIGEQRVEDYEVSNDKIDFSPPMEYLAGVGGEFELVARIGENYERNLGLVVELIFIILYGRD